MHSYDYRPWKPDASTENQISTYGKYTSPIHKSSPQGTEALSKGQVIRAEVIDLRGQEVKLQLNNSDVISAKISSDIFLSIGEEAIFQIEDITPGSLSLKVLADDRQLTQNVLIDKALENANLPKTARSISIVTELLKYQMSIDKGSIQNILKQAASFRNASIETLVIMNKYHIEPNEVNSTQLEAYRNYEHRLVQGFSTLADSILSGSLASSPEVVRNFHEHLLELATNVTTLSELSGSETKPDDIPQTGDDKQTVSTLPIENADNSPAATTILDSDTNPNAVYDTETFSSYSDLPLRSQLQNVTEQPQDVPVSSSLQLSSVLDYNQRVSFFDELPPTIQNTMDKNKFLDGSYNMKELLSNIKNALPSLAASSVSALIKSSAYQTVVKETVMSHWTLTPRMLKGKKNLETFYQKLTDDLSELKEFLHKASIDSQENSFDQAEQQTKNLQDNIEFMKTLNQLFSYVQLPLKLSNQNAHSELYVYTNKKALAADSSHISVLLHLDMEHLGPLDIHLDMNKNHVISKFYMKEDSKSLLQDHISLLTDALLRNGYSFSYELHKREHPVDLVKDILQEDEPNIGIKRYTFDIRA